MALLAFALSRLRKSALTSPHRASLLLLRAISLIALLFLAARPVWFAGERSNSTSRSVVLLMDRSESMALEEGSGSRYHKALEFLRARLLPALKQSQLPVQAFLFDRAAEAADGERLESTAPKGDRSNL